MKSIALMLAAVAALSASAAVRKLQEITVCEGTQMTLRGENATGIRSGDAAVATATLRNNEVSLSAVQVGRTELSFIDDRGVFASARVTVVPAYWAILEKLLADDPDVTVEIVGGKVVLSGSTANSETLRRVRDAKELDPERILSQVSYSSEALEVNVRGFLDRIGCSNITATVVGREVCLSGRVFDKDSAQILGERVRSFLSDFPLVNVNTSDLKVYRQKIFISIEFIDWDDNRARDLGIKAPDAISAFASFTHGLSWDGSDTDSNSSSRNLSGNSSLLSTLTSSSSSSSTTSSSSGSSAGPSVSSDSSSSSASSRYGTGGGSFDGGRTRGSGSSSHFGYQGDANLGIREFDVKLNMLKQNGVAKKTYGTTLSTQSGEEVKFQNGGTHYMKTMGNFSSGDVKKIDWGYNITARPVIVDEETVNLDFNLEYSEDLGVIRESGDYDITKYQTKSRYVVRPGESIVLSGFNKTDEAENKDGIPFLSRIPGMQWLFGETKTRHEKQEKLLVVTIDWQIEDSEGALKRLRGLKEREVSVEMP